MKIKYVVLLIVLVALVILPIPTSVNAGAYNTVSGMIYCNSREICLHEIGHKLDHEAGWISESAEFSRAVQVYLIYEIAHAETMDDIARRVLNYDGLLMPSSSFFRQAHKELYADLYRWSNGQAANMPEAFRSFYDWNKAAQFMTLYLQDDGE